MTVKLMTHKQQTLSAEAPDPEPRKMVIEDQKVSLPQRISKRT